LTETGTWIFTRETKTWAGDGDLDLYEGNEDVGRVLHINDGSGNFVESAQNFGNGMSLGLGAGDMDGDGDMDILEGNPAELSVRNLGLGYLHGFGSAPDGY
jgi:hypothetical protein